MEYTGSNERNKARERERRIKCHMEIVDKEPG
jgi:hypothetical protein